MIFVTSMGKINCYNTMCWLRVQILMILPYSVKPHDFAVFSMPCFMQLPFARLIAKAIAIGYIIKAFCRILFKTYHNLIMGKEII